MACYHPLTAYRGKGVDLKGANFGGISFDPRYAHVDGVEVLSLPCGQCIGCRLEKARQWAMRIVLEQKTSNSSCFVTLTYDEAHLPADRSLRQKDVTDFLKRLRSKLDYDYNTKIRYFYCGEYGSITQRPHYHLCLFGTDFGFDREVYKHSVSGTLWKSNFLQDIWQKGYCPFGELTYDSANYTARYVLKKINGPIADEHYQGRKPEFICMSRRPGIGSEWLSLYGDDIYSKDYLVMRNGIKLRPPRYYDRLYKDMHNDVELNDCMIKLLTCKERRKEYAETHKRTEEDLARLERYSKILTKVINDRRKERNAENVV